MGAKEHRDLRSKTREQCSEFWNHLDKAKESSPKLAVADQEKGWSEWPGEPNVQITPSKRKVQEEVHHVHRYKCHDQSVLSFLVVHRPCNIPNQAR
jgi:hypothetical protein